MGQTPEQTINWSDLQRDPTAARDLADTYGEVTIKRRGRPDLRLVRADRQSDADELMTSTARLLRNIISHGGAADAAMALSDTFPWLGFLPDSDRASFVKEFTVVLEGAADVGVPSAVARLIREWKATAAIHADPELYKIMTDRAGVGDFGVVEPPEADDAEEG